MRIVYMGSPEFAVAPFAALLAAGHEIACVVTQPDKPKGRGLALLPTPVKEAALAAGLPVLSPQKVNEPAVVAKIAAYRPELLVVVAFGQILRQELLELAPLGAVNVHGSLLPAYRGAAPIQRAVMDGCTETGVTTMFMDAGLDTGDMILKKRAAIEKTDTAASMYEKLAALGAEALLETVALIAEGRAPREKQPAAGASYAAMLKKEDGLLDWTRPASALDAQIRGVTPWPGAYTFWRGKRLKIWQAEPLAGSGPAGEILSADDKRGLILACGQDALLLKEVQPEGKGRMRAADFARGQKLTAGERMGE